MTYEDFIFKIAGLCLSKTWISKEQKEKMIALGNRLNDEELNLLFFLLDNFESISWQKYDDRIIDILDSIPIGRLQTFSNVLILPLQNQSGKSAPFVHRFFVSEPRIIHHNTFAGKNVCHQITDAKKIGCHFKNGKGSALFLVDDYVGSGWSTIEELSRLRTEIDFDDDNVFILSIAASKKGIDFLENFYTVFCPKIQSKIISDINNLQKKESFSELLLQIAQRFKLKNPFGYGNCEGLISLMRVPNNTIEMLQNNKRVTDAPFPRFL